MRRVESTCYTIWFLIKMAREGLAPPMEQVHKYAGLDVLRGFAALSVVLFHAHQIFNVAWLMPSAYLAVDIFFVMSGIVIAKAYEARIPKIGVFAFIKIRFIRFYPLYVLGLAFGVFRAVLLLSQGRPVLSPQDLLLAILGAALFLPPLTIRSSADWVSPLNGAAWSLIVEMWVNVAYALLLKWLTDKVLVAVVIIAALVLIYAYCAGFQGAGPSMGLLYVGFARGLFSFALGLLIYRRHNYLPRWPIPLIIPLGISATIFMLPQSGVSALFVTLLVSPLIVIASLHAKAPERLAAYLGIASFAIYAIHTPILQLMGGATNRLGVPAWLAILVPVGGLLVLVPLIDRWFDRPIRRLLSRKLARQVAAS